MRRAGLLSLFVLLFVSTVPFSAFAQQSSLTQTITGTTSQGQAFVGTFTPTRFSSDKGFIVAVGTLTGAIDGGQSITKRVSIPVSAIDATCPILNLTLGPIDLNLLGLMVHLNQVVLTITAQSGAGNLLGNLLCSLANLLNGGPVTGLLDQIVGLLNQILAAL